MKHSSILLMAIFCLFCLGLGIFFIKSSVKINYEVNSFTYDAIEYEDNLQFALNVEATNHSDKIIFFTFDFPSYILMNLKTQQAPLKINPNSSASISSIISVNKDGAEMSRGTIEALITKDLPIVRRFIFGESVKISEINNSK